MELLMDKSTVEMLLKILDNQDKNAAEINEIKLLAETTNIRLIDHLDQHKESRIEMSNIKDELKEYNNLLRDHIKRTELLEEKTDILHQDSELLHQKAEAYDAHLIEAKTKKDLTIRIFSILAYCATALGGVYTLLKFIGWF